MGCFVDYDRQQPYVASQPSFNDIRVNSAVVRYSGVVKFVNVELGFGFLLNHDTGKDVYFKTDNKFYRVGQKVSFSLIDGRNGSIAVNISVNIC